METSVNAKFLSGQPLSGRKEKGGLRIGLTAKDFLLTADGDLILTHGSFESCLKMLVKLPFVMTDEQVEPNMITVRSRKTCQRDYEFQIWRDSDASNSYESTLEGRKVDPNNLDFKEYEKYLDGNYTIELSCGPDFITSKTIMSEYF